MPQRVQGPRPGSQLRDEAELVGRVSLLFDEVIVPVIDVGGDFPSHVFPASASGRAWGHVQQNPDPGEFAQAWLLNREGSGHVAWIRQAVVSVEAGAITPIQHGVRFGISRSFVDTDPTLANAEPADTRRGDPAGLNNAVLEIRGASGGAPIANPEQLVVVSAPVDESDQVVLPLDLVLSPGWALFMSATDADRQLSVSLQWIERPGRTAELL